MPFVSDVVNYFKMDEESRIICVIIRTWSRLKHSDVLNKLLDMQSLFERYLIADVWQCFSVFCLNLNALLNAIVHFNASPMFSFSASKILLLI